MAFSSGSAIAPILGGKLTDVYGFRKTCDFVGFFAFFFAALNFCIVLLPNLVRSSGFASVKQQNFSTVDTQNRVQNN